MSPDYGTQPMGEIADGVKTKIRFTYNQTSAILVCLFAKKQLLAMTTLRLSPACVIVKEKEN